MNFMGGGANKKSITWAVGLKIKCLQRIPYFVPRTALKIDGWMTSNFTSFLKYFSNTQTMKG